jgi:TRAP-type C4-dicarboxylate transport system permease large subunit
MSTLLRTSIVLVLALSLAACELIGDIFQAGFWAGFVIVLLVLALIVWFMQRHKS